jgi:hypothetical protein
MDMSGTKAGCVPVVRAGDRVAQQFYSHLSVSHRAVVPIDVAFKRDQHNAGAAPAPERANSWETSKQRKVNP